MSEELTPGAEMASDVLESAGAIEPKGVETVAEETEQEMADEPAGLPDDAIMVKENSQDAEPDDNESPEETVSGDAAELPENPVTAAEKEQAVEAGPVVAEEHNPATVATAEPVNVEEADQDAESVAKPVPAEDAAQEENAPDYSGMSLAELSQVFEKFSESVDRLAKLKEAETIKAAFYKRLSKEKLAAGLEAPEVPSESEEAAPEERPVEDAAPKSADMEAPAIAGPFAALENGFRTLYLKYKKERADYNRKLEKEREENLAKKQAVVEDLKALVERQDDLGTAFPAFREIQARWRSIGQVPAQNFRNLNDTYQFYVEQFYDKVQINRDLRDLDFKKNMEAKEGFCEQAEKLAENNNIVSAFKELQKLHEQWKEYGPVAKEFRDSIWERFKAATAVINKKYQAYFEEQKARQGENLAAKTVLCEKAEAIADQEGISGTGVWNDLTKAIEDIQKEWKTIGFASKKENQKIYDRFRAACDKFFGKKRDFYMQYKEGMNANIEKKQAIIAEVEALKDTEEWKKATDRIISLQAQWKEIGTVPRKKSEQLWKRFRAACDAFFAERDSKSGYAVYANNLKAKKALIEEINAFEPGEKTASEARRDFAARWKEIGFVPFKEKEKITKAYNDAMSAKFGGTSRPSGGGRGAAQERSSAPKTEKDRLIAKYNSLQQDLDTYENNIGFFSLSKGSQPLVEQMRKRIEEARAELKALEDKIHALEEAE